MEDYTALVQARIERAVLEGYKSRAEFPIDVANTLLGLGVTYVNFNTYLNAAVTQGISPEAALECYVLTLQMKA